MSNSEQTSAVVPASQTDTTAAKLPYNVPEFTDLGSIEQITLGGFGTSGESLGGSEGSA